MWEMVRTELLELLVFLLTALLSVGAAYAIGYVRRLRAEVDGRMESDFAKDALAHVWHLVEVGIWTTESETARALREAVAQGWASRDELVELGRQLVDDVMATLTDEARLALSAAVGDVRGYVERLVDAELERLKSKGVIPRVRDLASPKSSPA